MSSSVVALAPAAPALNPDQQKQRQKAAKAELHAALAARVEADRASPGMAEADVGTVAIAVLAEVDATPPVAAAAGAARSAQSELDAGAVTMTSSKTNNHGINNGRLIDHIPPSELPAGRRIPSWPYVPCATESQ